MVSNKVDVETLLENATDEVFKHFAEFQTHSGTRFFDIDLSELGLRRSRGGLRQRKHLTILDNNGQSQRS